MAVRRLVILRAAPSEGLPNITNGLAVPLRSILNQSRVSCRFCIGTDVRVSWASRLVVQTDGANLIGDPGLCRQSAGNACFAPLPPRLSCLLLLFSR